MRAHEALMPRKQATIALGTLLTAFWINYLWAADLDNGLEPQNLKVGFTKAAFLYMNTNDVEAAFKVLSETVGRRRGYLVTTKTQIFEDETSFESAINNAEVNLEIIDAWTYLKMDISGAVTPFYVSSEQGQIGKRYVVLTRRGSGLITLRDLRSKDIVEFEIANTTLGPPWLEILLMTNNLGTHGTFFKSVDRVGKPNSAVLPVFFGKKHACVVDLGSFEIMTELNPQLGEKLQKIAVSDAYVDAFICLNNFGWTSEQFKQGLIDALGELHLDPAGQQLLTLFKTSQLVPFENAHLQTVKQLKWNYEELQARRPRVRNEK